LETPHDGYVDRLVYRKLSRPLTRLLLDTRWSPNAVTVAAIVIGVAGGLAFALPGPGPVLVGVLCLLVSGVLDCSDGELARLRLAESRLGHWLDITGDTVVHLALLAGVVLRLAAAHALPGMAVRGWRGLGVPGAFVVVAS